MLVLKEAGLVYLANPKTATQSLRAVLGPYARDTPKLTGTKHINATHYARTWAQEFAKKFGTPPQTFAVMRQPLEHLGSWHRYRQRDAILGHENSTHGISFAEFIEATLQPDPPPFARIGRQARFLGFLTDVPPVNFIFDYAQLDLMMVFVNERLGTRLTLPLRNVSPPGARDALALPPALMARLQTALEVEFTVYDQVSLSGVLETGVTSPLV